MERQRGINMIRWTCFIVFIAASAQGGPTYAPTVEVEPRGSVAVRVGDTLRIMCRLGTPLQVCRVEIPSTGSILLQPGQKETDGINYDGEGLNSGQCGVIINSVQMQQDGLFKCALVPNGSRSEVIGNVTIVVAKPPRRPQLLISKPIEDPSLSDNLKYRHAHGKAITISCSAQAGRPAPNLTIYLDDQPISRGSALVMNQSDGTSMVMQNLTHTLDWTDNGKILRCVVDHIALDQPEESKTELDVVFSPRGVSEPQRFGYVIGHPGIINLTVHGNPKPAFTWYVDGEEIREGLTDKSQRLQTSTARDLGKGTWYVELRIDSVQKSDTEKVYLLNARNDVGAEEYKIVLSTANEPEGLEIDTGYIIGIVVGILVLLLLVSLIIFARATGRWCFAGGSSSRNIGESSDTESAGRYSRSETDGGSGRPRRPRIMLSQLFKRNKDKVAGTDTDTMRTVVTVDDEKIPEPTDVTQKNQTAEGGLVYAELDLTQREATPPRRVSEDKTEYAEILYTKPEKETDENTENNKQ